MNTPDLRPSTFDLTFDFQEILQAILSKFWLFILSLLTFVVLGILYFLTATKYYQANAVVQVEQGEHNVVKIEDVAFEDLKNQEILLTIQNNLQRKVLIVRVVQQLNLKTNPIFKTLLAGPSAAPPTNPDDAIADVILANTNVLLRRNTRLIDVTVNMPSPELARDIANEIVEEFGKETLETRLDTSKVAYQFLMGEADRLKSKLATSENILQEYQALMIIRDRILDQQRLVDNLSQRYLDKHPKMIQARGFLKELQTAFLVEMAPLPNLAENDAAAAASLTSDQKFYRALRRAESSRSIINREVATDQNLYDSILQRLKETGITQNIEKLNVRVVEKATLSQIPVKPNKWLVLAVSVFLGTSFGLFSILLLHILDSSLKTTDDVESYLDFPVVGAIPEIKPKDILKSDPSTIQGLRWRFQRLIRSVFPQKETEIPFSKALPAFTNSLAQNLRATLHLNPNPNDGPRYVEGIGANSPLVVLHSQDSAAAEAIRTLRVNLSLLGKGPDIRTFLFTSAVPYEGKSFVAANFAVSMAQQNRKTLLIDADLRRPTIQDYFDKQRGRPGLSDYLAGQRKFEDILATTSISNLQIITAGMPCANPAEILASHDFAALLQEASKIFDHIVIDSAPVNPVSDTLLLAPQVQHVCLVTQAFRTPRRAIKHACQQLEHAKAHLVGIILNRIPERTGIRNPYHDHYQYPGDYARAYSKPYQT